ncbi:MAG: PaaI family thioesterase [Myxococcota bacterium]|nr:PaaI family thioesterase [Myxococcota bacterium]
MAPKDSRTPPPETPIWAKPAPGKLMGRGHSAGDLLEAYDWDVLERRDGLLRVAVHLPERLRNPKGELFGGFTPTYVDFLALHTYWAGREPTPGRPWLSTVNMRVDYYAPIRGDRFEIEGRVVHRRKSMTFVETRFFDPEGAMLAYAYTSLKET